jgi:peroxiredoxin
VEKQEGRPLLRSRFVTSKHSRSLLVQSVLTDPPGAFTPGCQARHLPPYIEKINEFKNKGVDVVAVIASNDSWVMNAWGKVNGVKGDDIVRTLPRCERE